MKTQFTFGFADEPQFRTTVHSRQWLANYLRACRSQKYLSVQRIGLHSFAVRKVGSDAVAHILPVQS